MRLKIYKSSVLASIISIAGALPVYIGIVGLLGKEYLNGIICIVVGILIQGIASIVAENAAFNKWKKEVVSKGYANRIAMGDYSCAAQLYQQNPGEKTLAYFATLNPDVTARLRNGAPASSAQDKKPTPAPSKPAAPNGSGQGLRCPGCGSPIGADFKFCLQCGRKIEPVRRCTCCGMKLDDGARFCRECGHRV